MYTWKSRWFNRKKYTEYLLEDTTLREWLRRRLRQSHVETIEIERSPNILQVIIKTARPGLLIGRGGEGAEKLKGDIIVFIQRVRKRFGRIPEKREVKVTIQEVSASESRAGVAVQVIADDLEKRLRFRRVLKQHLEKIAASKGVKGVKISLKGRLDGAEMARYEWAKKGRIPLQTLRAAVDYAEGTAYMSYGTIGVKVWVYKGDVFGETKDHI